MTAFTTEADLRLHQDIVSLIDTKTEYNDTTFEESLTNIQNDLQAYVTFIGEVARADPPKGDLYFTEHMNGVQKEILDMAEISELLTNLSKTLDDINKTDTLDSIKQTIQDALDTFKTGESGQGTKTLKERAVDIYHMTFQFRELAILRLQCCGFSNDSYDISPNQSSCKDMFPTINTISMENFAEAVGEVDTGDELNQLLINLTESNQALPFDLLATNDKDEDVTGPEFLFEQIRPSIGDLVKSLNEGQAIASEYVQLPLEILDGLNLDSVIDTIDEVYDTIKQVHEQLEKAADAIDVDKFYDIVQSVQLTIQEIAGAFNLAIKIPEHDRVYRDSDTKPHEPNVKTYITLNIPDATKYTNLAGLILPLLFGIITFLLQVLIQHRMLAHQPL